MKKGIVSSLILFTGLLSATFTSCNDVDLVNFSKDIKIQESLVTPIGEAQVSLGDLLNVVGEQDLVGTDADSIYLQISDSLEFKYKIFNVNKYIEPLTFTFTPFQTNQTLPPNFSFPVIESTEDVNLGINTDITNQRVDSVWINSVKFNVSLDANVGSADNYSYEVSFPGNNLRYANGNPIELTGTFSSFNQIDEVVLKDLKLYTTNASSVLPIKLKIIAITGNTTTNVDSQTTINVTTELKEIDYEVAFGLFDPQPKEANPYTLNFNLSEYLRDVIPANISYNMKLANPKIDVQFQSNIGNYLNFNVGYLKAYEKDNPSVYAKSIFDNGTNSMVENLKKPAMYEFVKHDFKQLTRTNGSTNLFFDMTKNFDTFEFEWSMTNNVDSMNAHPTSSNFILNDTRIKTKIKFTVPLYFDAGTSISYSDTIKNIGSGISTVLKDNALDTVILVLTIKNGLPIKVNLELTNFLDALGNELNLPGLDKIYNIDSPEVNADGTTSKVAESQIQINIGKNQVNELKKLENLKFMVTVAGKLDTSAIQFTKNNTLGVKAGVYVKGTATLNLDNMNN